MIKSINKENFSILIVDDEPKNIQLLGNILKEEGYVFEYATSGTETLDWVSNKSFDLILLDIMMPGMDGYEVCKRLKSNPETAEILILFLSAKAEMESIVKGFDCGAVDYITKPFNKKELLVRVETHLELKKYRDHLEELVREKTSELESRNLELEKINKATGHFVPYDFLNILGKDSIIDVRLGDQVYREMTILFSDIRDYTQISETMSPQEVFGFTNSYHSQMSPLIRTHKGFVQQFQGDGVVSVFPESANNSVLAAIAIQKQVRMYNVERAQKKRELIRVGIGLHTGSLMVGIIGDEERWESGIPSDTVNTAARLEGLTKFYGSSIIISESTYNSLVDRDQFKFRFLDKVRMKGKQATVGIYEILDAEPDEVCQLKIQTLDDFNKGLECFFSKDFKSAQEYFYKIIEINPNDQTVTRHLKQAISFCENGVPDDWDGVTKFVRK
jgi:two-component system, sensor histidine kinase ChiS